MEQPTLVIMAAGMGSRFGGCKQITPVDAQGHIIIDYSIFDAVQAGFQRVICIIKPEMADDFRAAIGDRIASRVKLEYAYQSVDALPEGFSVPEGRQKPWGTAHAVLCALPLINGPFAVINADDFYGRDAFQTAYDFLAQPGDENEHAMVGYRIENTLTENGSVSRGVCAESSDGCLSDIVERTRIELRGGVPAFTEDEGLTYTAISEGTPVSMNLWAFRRGILNEFSARFKAFLQESVPANPLKCEFYLPYVPKALIQEGRARVRVLHTDEKWYGMTYRKDILQVKQAIASMKAAGVYPEKLWQ